MPRSAPNLQSARAGAAAGELFVARAVHQAYGLRRSNFRQRMKSRALLALWLGLALAAGAPASSNLELARQLNQAFVEVADKVSPSVVVINVSQKPGTAALDTGDDSDEDQPSREQWRRFHRQLEEAQIGRAHD